MCALAMLEIEESLELLSKKYHGLTGRVLANLSAKTNQVEVLRLLISIDGQEKDLPLLNLSNKKLLFVSFAQVNDNICFFYFISF